MLHIRPEPLLRNLTSLRLGGKALAELSFDEESDLDELAAACASVGGLPFVLGGGTNILATDGPLPLVLLRPPCKGGLELVELDQDKALVHAAAGVRMPRLLAQCATWGLSGFEGLVGIPGTVGGAVAMNAGSYGCETARLLHSLRIWSPEAGPEILYPDQWKFVYRKFVLKKNVTCFFILSASFCLTRVASNGIRESMRLNYFQKKSTQPVKAWSAGCAFKNPSPGLSAGKLLDDAGFKGKRLGGMAFSPLHANFLINEGRGSAAAAFDLLQQAREAVLQREGISLQLEIKVLP